MKTKEETSERRHLYYLKKKNKRKRIYNKTGLNKNPYHYIIIDDGRLFIGSIDREEIIEEGRYIVLRPRKRNGRSIREYKIKKDHIIKMEFKKYEGKK